jgi:hypothetical protein
MEASVQPESALLSPSRVIAEALVDRQGPKQITARARRLGFPAPLTTAVVAACCSTAVDRPRALRRVSLNRINRRARFS